MKRTTPLAWAILAPLLSGLLLPVDFSIAIPNNFGGGGFINPAGMRFEDFAALPDSWAPKADLKAPWERWSDDTVDDTSVEIIKMSLGAIIFGIPADEVVAYRKDEAVQRFVVGFRPTEDRPIKQLESAVRRNLGIWADSGKENSYLKGGILIELLPTEAEEDRVRVSFRPANALSATAG